MENLSSPPGYGSRSAGLLGSGMHTLVIRLDPKLLSNPDADLRYVLPDLLVERSSGNFTDDGYDYLGEEPYLVLFLKASNLSAAISCVTDMIENVRVLDNDLRPATVVAVETPKGYEIVHPASFDGKFLAE
jgi:hypothetical protein